jgi:hypothetical protein
MTSTEDAPYYPHWKKKFASPEEEEKMYAHTYTYKAVLAGRPVRLQRVDRIKGRLTRVCCTSYPSMLRISVPVDFTDHRTYIVPVDFTDQRSAYLISAVDIADQRTRRYCRSAYPSKLQISVLSVDIADHRTCQYYRSTYVSITDQRTCRYYRSA